MRLNRLHLLLPFLLVGAACTNSGENLGDAGTTDNDGGVIGNDGGPNDSDSGVPPSNWVESPKSNLKFKRNERLRNDVAQALGLQPGQVCNELGQYSCTDFVHKVTLGGVEPYELGLNEPLANTSITTPIATERVVLSACTKRVTDDLSAANPVIFRDLGLQADGKLADPNAVGVRSSIETLYQRALLRAPKDGEVANLVQLYRDIEADGGADAGRDWAILSCFSVLSSLEALFY